jgi:hypothetical protein
MLLRFYEAVAGRVARAEPWLSILAAASVASYVFAFFLVSPTLIFPLFLLTMWLCGLAMTSRSFSPRIGRNGPQSPSRMSETAAFMRSWNLYVFTMWWALNILFTVGFGFRVLSEGRLPAFHRVDAGQRPR